MDESSCKIDDDAANDMEIWYMRKHEQGYADGAQNPCLDKHVQLFQPTSDTLGASEQLKVGQLYEIDHSKNDFDFKKGSCWSQLKFTGMQWGKRRQVKFLGRREEHKFDSLSGSGKLKVTGFGEREEIEREEGTTKKRKKSEEKEPFKVMSSQVKMTRKSERNQYVSGGNKKSKKPKHDKLHQQVVYNKKKKLSIDRWSAERYKLAEENMLKVMKAKGAVYGSPILRPALRSEARKLIGDTGLLDHLLKHMAGRVVPGGTERFRRRHNAEGAMEYWLENADLVNVRREAGIQDPYWTPPPGWKPGDNPSQDPICARELRQIKEEMSKLKHDMQELVLKKQEEELAIVTTPNSCMSSLNLDNEGSLVSMQEMYADLVNKKTKIEEQMKEISLTLSSLGEQLGVLKTRVEEPKMSESVKPPALLLGPTVEAGAGGETKEDEEDKNKGRKSAEEQFDEDIQRPESRTAEGKAARIARLKSGFRICKPQGTFVWPNGTMSPEVVVQLDDHIVVPTPSSASSSTEPQHVPNPSSPVKPLAERRPVSIATLTHVTGPFSPHLSPPLGTTGSNITATEDAPLINLNEAPPPQCYDPSICATQTNQLALAAIMPNCCPNARRNEVTEKKPMELGHCELQHEKEDHSSSSSHISEKKGWWQLAMARGRI